MRVSKRFFRALLGSAGWWLGVATSIVLYLSVAQMVRDKANTQLEYQTHNVQLAIQNRVNAYVDLLRSVEALFYSHEHVSRAEFHDYVTHLLKQRQLPGIVSINYAQSVSHADKRAFEEMVRRDTSLDPRGYPDFRIRPPGDRPLYQVLVYAEPIATNAASFGLDFASNPRSAQAFYKARDDGQLISSGRLIRVRGPRENVALAMRIPIYRRNAVLDSVAARRAAMIGSVGAGYDLTELMQGALDRNMAGNFRIRLYDTGSEEDATPGTTDRQRLLYEQVNGTMPADASADNRFFVKRAAMTVGRRVWEIEFTADRSTLLQGFEGHLPLLVLAASLLASLLLFGVYYSLTTARRRAVELAAEMTKDLRASEASLAEAQRMAHLGSWLLEYKSGTMSWSMETYRILGLPQSQPGQHYHHFLRALHEDDRRMVRQGLDRALRTGEQFQAEHRIRRPDGAVHWVQTTARREGDEGDDGDALRGIMMDITERKQTVDALRRSQELLRELTAHQDRVKEDERKRIAREIHDELGQTLLALRIDVSMLEARTGNTHPRLNRKVRDALQHLDATVKTIRTIINNLRPAVLDLGLNAAIEWQVNEFRRRSGIACELVMEGQEFKLDDARATSLFRILQESLTNVIRHANASNVRIELRQEGSNLVMKIVDDGIGIAADQRESGSAFGLVGVEERILALSGTFTIESSPGAGTALTIYIPLEGTPAETRRSGT